jgi:hypothetical protein
MSRIVIWVLGLLGIVGAAVLAYYGTLEMGLGEYNTGQDLEPIEGDLADMTPGQRLCASQTTIDSIRRRIFTRARAATEQDGAELTRLENGTVARMEEPRLLDFDEGVEQARCEGRLILELPRGTEPAFNNSRRLAASLDYIAQPAPDGSGSIYRIAGADGIIDRLANADLLTRRPSVSDEEKPDLTIDDIIERETGKDEIETEDMDSDEDQPVQDDADAAPAETERGTPEELLPPAMQDEDPDA